MLIRCLRWMMASGECTSDRLSEGVIEGITKETPSNHVYHRWHLRLFYKVNSTRTSI